MKSAGHITWRGTGKDVEGSNQGSTWTRPTIQKLYSNSSRCVYYNWNTNTVYRQTQHYHALEC